MDAINSPTRRTNSIIILGICANSVISLILFCTLHEVSLPLGLPVSDEHDGGRAWMLGPWAPAPDYSDSLEVRKLLGCDQSNWGECVRAASRFADSQAVFAEQKAAHHSQALERAIDGPTEYSDIKLFPHRHPVFAPLDPRNQPRPEWDKDRAFPDISIAGLPKAGSTQMHTMLRNHPEAVVFGNQKEECMSRGPYRSLFEDWDNEPNLENQTTASVRQLQVQVQLYLYYDKIFSGERPSGVLDPSKRKTVNACYWIHDIEISWHYLQRPQGKKSIFLFRDPADWLWSAFNFWKTKDLDPVELGWTKPGENYRSPELFHELVASGNMTKWGVYSREYYHTFTIRSPRKLVALFGRENALFLRNEDLLPEVVAKEGGVLDQLSNFTGLDRSQFDPSTYSVVTNCNDMKGMTSVCNKTRSTSYALSGGREMLPETRTLIYMQFWEECKIWAREFGVFYPDCLNVMENTQSQRVD